MRQRDKLLLVRRLNGHRIPYYRLSASDFRLQLWHAFCCCALIFYQ